MNDTSTSRAGSTDKPRWPGYLVLGIGLVLLLAVFVFRPKPVPPGPGPVPPGPAPDPAGSFLVIVTDNDNRTPDQAALLESDDLWKWLGDRKVGWRVIDKGGAVFRDQGYDSLLSADGVQPAAVVLWSPGNASHKTAPLPGNAEALKQWITGSPHTGPPFIVVDGEKRYLTRLPPSEAKLMAPRGGEFSAVHAPIPRSQWKEVNNRQKFPAGEWIYDQDGIGSCFPMGTRIRMADGSEKPIEQVRLLDQVLTAEGNVRPVTQLMIRPEKDGLLNLKLWGHSHLKLTKEHPVLTRRGYVRADQITPDDWVSLPRYLPGAVAEIETAPHVGPNSQYVNQTRKRTIQSVLGRKPVEVVYNHVPEKIRLTPAAGRIIGLFLAEGNTTYGKVTFTFASHEETTLAAELISLLKSEWGADASLQIRGNNSVNVSLHGTRWARLFESLCSTGAGDKKLHPDLTAGPPDFLESVLYGWLDGDGHERRGGRQGKTVSHDLAMNMFDIANGLGLRPSILRSEPSLNKHAATRRAFWVVGLDAHADSWSAVQEEKHLWRKVRDITRENFDGFVYNMEVEGDHSYVAEGVGVHNCVGNGSTAALRKARYLAGMTDMRLAPGCTYSQINGGHDNGAVISDSLTALQHTGTITSQTLGSDQKPFYTRQLPQGWQTEAKRFRIEEAYHCSTYDDMATAVQLGYILVFGLDVGNNFDRYTSEGVVGYSSGWGNHCVHADGLHKLNDGSWVLDTCNSWGASWGPWKNGRCYVTEKHVSPPDQPDAYAVKTAVEDPLDPRKPPKPKAEGKAEFRGRLYGLTEPFVPGETAVYLDTTPDYGSVSGEIYRLVMTAEVRKAVDPLAVKKAKVTIAGEDLGAQNSYVRHLRVDSVRQYTASTGPDCFCGGDPSSPKCICDEGTCGPKCRCLSVSDAKDAKTPPPGVKPPKKPARPDGLGYCSDDCCCGCNKGNACTCGSPRQPQPYAPGQLFPPLRLDGYAPRSCPGGG